MNKPKKVKPKPKLGDPRDYAKDAVAKELRVFSAPQGREQPAADDCWLLLENFDPTHYKVEFMDKAGNFYRGNYSKTSNTFYAYGETEPIPDVIKWRVQSENLVQQPATEAGVSKELAIARGADQLFGRISPYLRFLNPGDLDDLKEIIVEEILSLSSHPDQKPSS